MAELTRKQFLGVVGGITASGILGRSSVAAADRPRDEDTPLRILAWNIFNGRFKGKGDIDARDGEVNLRQMIEFIRYIDPDLFFTVETYGAGEELLAGLNEGRSTRRRFTAVKITQDTPEQETNPNKDNLWVFSRHTVVERYPVVNEDVVSSFNFGGVRIRLPGGQEINCFTTWLWHANWAWGNADDSALDIRYGLDRRWSDQEILDTDYSSKDPGKNRFDMAKIILEERLPQFIGDSSDPVLLCGDFNTMSHRDWTEEFADAPGHEGLVLAWPVMKLFEDAGFIDTYRATLPDAGLYPGRTWSPYEGFGVAPGRIDYILVRGEGVEIASSATFTRRLPSHQDVDFDTAYPFYSDHGALATDLVIKQGGETEPVTRPPLTEAPFIPPAKPAGTVIPATEIAVTATSVDTVYQPRNVLDEDPKSFWFAATKQEGIELPQSLTFDLGRIRTLQSMTYLGRAFSRYNGQVLSWRIDSSTDGTAYNEVTTGTWENNCWEQLIPLAGTAARFVRFVVLWGYAGHAAAAQIRLYA